jgi:hypothetical protein
MAVHFSDAMLQPLQVQREASAVCDGLLVQRLYSGRRGDGDGKKLVDAAKQDVNKDGSLRLKTLFVVQAGYPLRAIHILSMKATSSHEWRVG